MCVCGGVRGEDIAHAVAMGMRREVIVLCIKAWFGFLC